MKDHKEKSKEILEKEDWCLKEDSYGNKKKLKDSWIILREHKYLITQNKWESTQPLSQKSVQSYGSYDYNK